MLASSSGASDTEESSPRYSKDYTIVISLYPIRPDDGPPLKSS